MNLSQTSHWFADTLAAWQQSGRIDGLTARFVARKPAWMAAHIPLRLLPLRLHRFICDQHRLPRYLRLGPRWLAHACYQIDKHPSDNKIRTPLIVITIVLTWCYMITFHQMNFQWHDILPAWNNLWFFAMPPVFFGPIAQGLFIAGLTGSMRLFNKIKLTALSGLFVAIFYTIGAFYLEKSWHQGFQPAFWLPLLIRSLLISSLALGSAIGYEVVTYVRSKSKNSQLIRNK